MRIKMKTCREEGLLPTRTLLLSLSFKDIFVIMITILSSVVNLLNVRELYVNILNRKIKRIRQITRRRAVEGGKVGYRRSDTHGPTCN